MEIKRWEMEKLSDEAERVSSLLSREKDLDLDFEGGEGQTDRHRN